MRRSGSFIHGPHSIPRIHACMHAFICGSTIPAMSVTAHAWKPVRGCVLSSASFERQRYDTELSVLNDHIPQTPSQVSCPHDLCRMFSKSTFFRYKFSHFVMPCNSSSQTTTSVAPRATQQFLSREIKCQIIAKDVAPRRSLRYGEAPVFSC